MLVACLSAMLSFGTCNGNRGGFTVCTVKNNLGILVCLVVEFIPKRTRFELQYLFCGGHFRKQMYSICMCFQDYYCAGYVVCFVSVILFPVVFHVALIYKYFYLCSVYHFSIAAS